MGGRSAGAAPAPRRRRERRGRSGIDPLKKPMCCQVSAPKASDACQRRRTRGWVEAGTCGSGMPGLREAADVGTVVFVWGPHDRQDTNNAIHWLVARWRGHLCCCWQLSTACSRLERRSLLPRPSTHPQRLSPLRRSPAHLRADVARPVGRWRGQVICLIHNLEVGGSAARASHGMVSQACQWLVPQLLGSLAGRGAGLGERYRHYEGEGSCSAESHLPMAAGRRSGAGEGAPSVLSGRVSDTRER